MTKGGDSALDASNSKLIQSAEHLLGMAEIHYNGFNKVPNNPNFLFMVRIQ